MSYKNIIFIMGGLVQALLDPLLNRCNNPFGKFLILAHHQLSAYLILGSFVFGNHKLHIVILTCAFMVHKIFKICPLTRLHNKICGLELDKPLYTVFNHVTSTTEQAVCLYYYTIALVIWYDLKHILM